MKWNGVESAWGLIQHSLSNMLSGTIFGRLDAVPSITDAKYFNLMTVIVKEHKEYSPIQMKFLKGDEYSVLGHLSNFIVIHLDIENQITKKMKSLDCFKEADKDIEQKFARSLKKMEAVAKRVNYTTRGALQILAGSAALAIVGNSPLAVPLIEGGLGIEKLNEEFKMRNLQTTESWEYKWLSSNNWYFEKVGIDWIRIELININERMLKAECLELVKDLYRANMPIISDSGKSFYIIDYVLFAHIKVDVKWVDEYKRTAVYESKDIYSIDEYPNGIPVAFGYKKFVVKKGIISGPYFQKFIKRMKPRGIYKIREDAKKKYKKMHQSEEDRVMLMDAMDGKESMYAHPPGGKRSTADQTFLDEAGFNFVLTCLDALEKRGLEDQGLYRTVGVSSKVTKLLTVGLDKKKLKKVNFDDAYEWETETMTSAVKKYFRNLSEPIMTFSLHQKFIAAAKLETNASRLSEVHRLVHLLPSPNQRMLEILLEHLSKIFQKSNKNLMSVSNLGVVFGPTLLRSEEEETVKAIMEVTFANVVVEILIKNWEQILRTKPDTSPPKPLNSHTHTPLKDAKIDQGKAIAYVKEAKVNDDAGASACDGCCTIL